MDDLIFISGATGNVGKEIAQTLLHLGISPRLGDNKVERARKVFGDNPNIVPFNFTQPETFAPALSGIKKMFLMRPPAITNVKRFILPVINAALLAGVHQIVFLSLIGVEKNTVVPHHKIEKYILASGMDYTFLRPSFFMQNLSTTHQAEIRDQDEIFVPAGQGRTNFIDVRDIAAVAALALSQTGHKNRAYDLTGSQSLDYYEIAALLSTELGRQITYRNPNVFRFVQRQLQLKTPLPFALVMAALYTVSNLGLADTTTGETARLLGRAPITIKQFIHDNHDCWLPRD